MHSNFDRDQIQRIVLTVGIGWIGFVVWGFEFTMVTCLCLLIAKR